MAKFNRLNKISAESIKEKTGKSWDEWIDLLNKAGAKDWTHKEIVAFLSQKQSVGGWWQQMLANGYEKAIGRRILGQTLSAGFEIGVTKTLPVKPHAAWKFLTSQPGRLIWEKGAQTEIRTQKEGERIRMTYKSPKLKAPSVLQMIVTPRQSTRGTCIGFHQEKLSSLKERATMKAHWKNVLEKIGNSLL